MTTLSIAIMQVTCCNYAGFEVLLQLCRCYFLIVMLVNLSAAIMQVTDVAIIQLKVSTALTLVKVSAANMWVATLIVIMQVDTQFSQN